MLVERIIHGSPMLLDTEDPGLSAELIENGTREGETPDRIEGLVQPGWTCIDIGANLGFYTLRMHRAKEIFAIEPVPRNVEILEKNLELNNIDAMVIECAIGDRCDTVSFQVAHQSNWGSVVNDRPKPMFITHCIDVDMMTLDSLTSVFDIVPDFLRFDIEGGEIDLVRGAQNTLPRMPIGSWLCGEFHFPLFDDHNALLPTFDNLMSHGFCIRDSIGTGSPNIFWEKCSF